MSTVSGLTIASSAGALAAAVHLPQQVPAPVVVCCHGMLSSKDSRKFVSIGEELSGAGLAAVRFDFSGCGESQAALGQSLLGSRLRDLHAVLDHVCRQSWVSGPVGLLGSSLGGYLSLLAAASGEHNIQAVVCWATPFDLQKIREALESSDTLKHLFPPAFRLGGPQDLGKLAAVRNVCVIHGQQDETVPWRQATEIYRRVGEPRRLMLMETAEHRFLDPLCRGLALRASLDWFRECGLVP